MRLEIDTTKTLALHPFYWEYESTPNDTRQDGDKGWVAYLGGVRPSSVSIILVVTVLMPAAVDDVDSVAIITLTVAIITLTVALVCIPHVTFHRGSHTVAQLSTNRCHWLQFCTQDQTSGGVWNLHPVTVMPRFWPMQNWELHSPRPPLQALISLPFLQDNNSFCFRAFFMVYTMQIFM